METFGALGLLAALAGCTSPQLETPRWSEERGMALPTATRAASQGSLLVTTEVASAREEWTPERRGFAVFDAQGALVHSTHGAHALERVRLAPGRYVVVSLVGQGLVRRNEQRQALVAAGAETRVDFTTVEPASTPAELARH